MTLSGPGLGLAHHPLPSEDLNMIAAFGTSDGPCWQAEACEKPLLQQCFAICNLFLSS